jgi:Holliday junction resolvasome RuvABC DNA-binding subunit
MSQQLHHSDEALEALMALGYNLNDATRALEGVPTDLSTADRVTQALKA